VEWSSKGWTAVASPFVRWDNDVIDWVRATPAELWRTTNVRDVRSTGLEASLGRRWSSAWIRGHVTALDVDAPSLNTLSKYVLEYAKYSAGSSFSLPLGWNLRASGTLDYRHRADGQKYTLLGAKGSYAIRRTEIFVDGTNLLNETYREISGVSMPGRWVMVGVSIN